MHGKTQLTNDSTSSPQRNLKFCRHPYYAGRYAAIDANLETDARGERTAYGSSFWIRKAIGWALRQQARTDPQWSLDFVADHRDRMAGLSIREALKHLD